jgi:uncharacterized Ntn-hydrolase superfamily protein
MTFSLIGRCGRTGMFGVAITTSSIAVASRCPWARAGAGAVATQNITDPRLGPQGLDLMAKGTSAEDALRQVMTKAPHAEYRQVLMIDRKGGTGSHTGSKILGINAVAPGDNCIAAGNLLSNPDVPVAMARAFSNHPEMHIAERLMLALESGVAAGGEMGSVRSAGLLVVHDQPWPLVDLRVDWDEQSPVSSLRRIWDRYQPQMADYVTRALNPAAAPAYGVPGDP